MRWVTGARAAFFALLPAAAASGAMVIPVLLSGAALPAAKPSLVRNLQRSAAALAVLAFLAWAMISSLWSTTFPIVLLAKLLLLLPLGAAFARAAGVSAPSLTLAGALAAFAVLALLLGAEALDGLLLTRLANPEEPLPARAPSRGAVVLLSMAWGCCAALAVWRRPALAALSVGAAGWISLQFGQSANTVAFAAGLAAFGAALVWPRASALGVCCGLGGWTLAAPFATPLLTAQLPISALPHSFAARVEIWNYAAARILERPLIGRGLDASRAVTDRITVDGESFRAIPLHPHSASLQIWYETGFIGAALAAAAICIVGRALARRVHTDGRIATAAGAATLATLGVIANVSYGLWQEWWIACFFVAAAVNAALRAAKA